MKYTRNLPLSAAVLFALFAPPAPAEESPNDYLHASYTKYEHMVPMRDGVRLFTAVYVPKDASQKYPFLITRTPYTVAPYGADNYRDLPSNFEKFAKEGFIFVYQDVRGTTRSEGVFVNAR